MKKITYFLFVFSTLSFAQTPVPFFPTSGFSGSDFGSKLAIHNSNVAVASRFQPFFPSNNTGKVYVFDSTGNVLTQTAVLYPDGELNNDYFGYSLSISDDFLAVGSPYSSQNSSNPGKVYLYKKTNGNWDLSQILPGNSSAFNFGSSVKIYNGFLFVTTSGLVQVYKLNDSLWEFQQELPVTGSKIEIENNIAIIGTQVLESGFGSFSRCIPGEDGNWIVESTSPVIGTPQLEATDFGFSDNTIYVISTSIGMLDSDINGAVSSLTYTDGNWQSTPLFESTGLDTQVWTKLTVSGDKMFIGSEAYILAYTRHFPLLYYKKTGDAWAYSNALHGTASGSEDDYFGSVSAIDGNNLLVGAPSEGFIHFGQAYVFDMTLGIDTFNKNVISIYPNPVNDILHIKNTSDELIEKAEVFSVTGKLLMTRENPSEMSLQNLASGMYMMKFTASGGQNQTFKVIKN